MKTKTTNSRLAPLAIAITAVLVATGGFAYANLVTNPGFETGDFTGWTVTPAASGSFLGVNLFAHSGTYDTSFGGTTVGSFDSISQSLATTNGGLYQLSFWLETNLGSSADEFRASFGGVIVSDTLNSAPFGYTEFTISNLLATSSSTTLEFEGYNLSGFFELDDISVVQTGFAGVPDAGSSALLLGLALMGFAFTRRALGWRFSH